MRHTRSRGQPLESPKEDINRFVKELKKNIRMENRREAEDQNFNHHDMGVNGHGRVLRDYAMPSIEGAQSSIQRPPIQANNFELKPALISMISQNQFSGLDSDDPNAHLSYFLQMCDTIKLNGVTEDAIRLRLFPFSLIGRAREWLNSKPVGHFTTWNDLAQSFMAKYFPPGKTSRLRNEITNFMQMEGESLYECWERFKELQRRCPHHRLPKWMIMQIFYDGLNFNTKTTVDAAAGGSLLSKSEDDAYQVVEGMASNSHMWANERRNSRRVAGVHDVDSMTMLSAQMQNLMKDMGQIKSTLAAPTSMANCDLCDGVGHSTADCQVGNPFGGSSSSSFEQANYIGGQPRPQYNPYSNTYNPGWRNHPNFSWGGNQQAQQSQQTQFQKPSGPPGYQSQYRAQPQEASSLENMLKQFIDANNSRLNQMESKYDQLMKNQSSSIHNLEVQIGQLANEISQRNQGSLPSNTEANPRAHVRAISLRSGKEVGSFRNQNVADEDTAVEKDITAEQPIDKGEGVAEKDSMNEGKGESSETKVKGDLHSPYVPPLHFLRKKHQEVVDRQFSAFLEKMR